MLQLERLSRKNPKKLVKEEDIANQSKGAENEIKQRVLDCRAILEEEKKSKVEIAGEMASQYKRLQENLSKRAAVLKDQADKLQEEIAARDKTLEEMKKAHETKIQKKDMKIEKLKKSMTQMSDKFLAMLQETLKKMRERIDSASNEFEKQNEGSLRKKLEEINIGKS